MNKLSAVFSTKKKIFLIIKYDLISFLNHVNIIYRFLMFDEVKQYMARTDNGRNRVSLI